MKGKEWFSLLKTQGKISHEDFDKLIETAPDFEIPDGAIKAFEQRFMTPDRAVTNDEVIRTVRHSTLDPIDKDIKSIVEYIESIDKYSAMEISRLTRKNGKGEEFPDTYKQFQALKEKLPALIDKVRVAPNDEDAKKKLADQKKALDELTEKFTKVAKEKEESIKQVDEQWGKKFKDHKIDAMLEKMSNSYTFGEAYEKQRELLTKAILGELKSGNSFDIAMKEGAEVLGVFEQKDGAMIPKFNGNNPVTAQGLLDEKFKPFLKMNGVETQQEQMTTQKFTVNPSQNNQSRKGGNVSVAV